MGMRMDVDGGIGHDPLARLRKLLLEEGRPGQSIRDMVEAVAHSCRVITRGASGEEAARLSLARAGKAATAEAAQQAREQFLLNQGPDSFPSPWDGGTVPLIGGLPDLQGQQFFHFFGGQRPGALLFLREAPAGVYCFREHLFLCPRSVNEKHVPALLRRFFTLLLERPAHSLAYLDRLLHGKPRRALVLGDFRPHHFLSQSLNALDGIVIPRLAEFASKGGIVIIARDGCFLDPRVVFPELRGVPILELDFPRIARFAIEEGYACERFIRIGSETDYGVARRFLDSVAPGDSPHPEDTFEVWVTLEIEKFRFRNQTEQVAEALVALQRRAGRRLRVLWDGWTVSAGRLSEKDQRVIAAAQVRIEDILARAAIDCECLPLFHLELLPKLSRARRARIALAGYGTASMIASRLAGVPTVSYGVKNHVGDASLVEPERATVITEPLLRLSDDLHHKSDFQGFHVQEGAVAAAAVALLDRLA